VSTRTIGAGGGSIGWVDPGGFLQVGPQSAGADPGPACYGRGGEEATITDANLVLGRLNPDFFLGGRLFLDPALARRALARVGGRLGQDAVAVAASMVRIANENMANAIRIVTVEQGTDPRELALVAMGGAGPMHAAEIADSIGVARVLVPVSPGLGSAFGALAAPLRVDAVKSIHLTDRSADPREVRRVLAALEARALADFEAQAGGVVPATLRRAIAMRYQGQNYEQEVPIPDGALDARALEALYSEFGRLYQSFYGYRLDGIPIELVRLQVVVQGEEPALAPPAAGGEAGPAGGSRPVWFPEGGFLETRVLRRQAIAAGSVLSGPLVVEEMDSTVVVPPGWRLEVQQDGLLDLRKEGGG
jgi:N-methylhydantoinase A